MIPSGLRCSRSINENWIPFLQQRRPASESDALPGPRGALLSAARRGEHLKGFTSAAYIKCLQPEKNKSAFCSLLFLPFLGAQHLSHYVTKIAPPRLINQRAGRRGKRDAADMMTSTIEIPM